MEPYEAENEIKISDKASIGKTMERINDILETYDRFTLSGTHAGIPKLLLITQMCKEKYILHQYNSLDSEKTNVDDPNVKQSELYTPIFKVIFSKNELNPVPKNFFYQPPLTENEIKTIEDKRKNNVIFSSAMENKSFDSIIRSGRGREFRGRGRGERGERRRGARGGNYNINRGRDLANSKYDYVQNEERNNNNNWRGRGRGGRWRG